MTKEHQIYQILETSGGYISRVDIRSRSLYYTVLEMVKQGKLFRIKPGVFALTERMASIMYDIERIAPGSILCAYSAWSYYGLTTQIPSSLCIAVRKGRRLRLPEYPPITLYYVSDNILDLGTTRAVIDGIDVQIYDEERCVCDAIKYRNKIGIDVCSEILNNYLRKKGANLTKLNQYAKILRVQSTLRKYLEVIL